MNRTEAPRQTESASTEAYDFVQSLAAELASGKVELPSFPEVALRVQRALSRPEISDVEVLRAVGAEPALALRVLQMANSIGLNSRGRPVVELRSAIARVGFNMVRSAALAFIIQQLRNTESFRHLREPLRQLWLHSVNVGSLGFVVAKRFTKVNADLALLAGVLHGVGKLHILTRAALHPRLIADAATYEQIVRDWHTSIARALLQSWEISPEIVQAIHEFEDVERDSRGPVGLAEVLTVADLLATYRHEVSSGSDSNTQMRNMRLSAIAIWQRVRIDRQGCEAAIEEATEEIAALRRVLDA